MDTTAKLRELSARVKSQTNARLHDKPALWAGIATGAGFALGIAGRLLRYRLRRRALPAIVIISECRT